MKILYALSGTGNGHVSRAREIIPHLQRHGELEIAVTGGQNEVALPVPVDTFFPGPAFAFGSTGTIDLRRSLRELKLIRTYRQARRFDPSKYDLIVNDFDPVTAWTARARGFGARVVAFGHQASFLSRRVPRPAHKSIPVEYMFQHYAPASRYVGLHFASYDSGIHPPIIRAEVRALRPRNEGHYTVYLPAYGEDLLVGVLSQFNAVPWKVFSKSCRKRYEIGSITVQPIRNEDYLQALESCNGLLTGGGFEAPAEALFLGKKVFMVPMRRHYEQACNAAAAARTFGIPIASDLRGPWARRALGEWLAAADRPAVNFPDDTGAIVQEVVFGADRRGEAPTRPRP